MLENFDILSFVGGLVSGGFGGALLTLTFSKKTQQSSGGGNTADQSGSKAGGDIVGRDKN